MVIEHRHEPKLEDGDFVMPTIQDLELKRINLTSRTYEKEQVYYYSTRERR